jgi:hypothetical protein
MPHLVTDLDKEPAMQTNTTIVRSVVRVAVAVTAIVALGACASIPKRAWANGEAMTSSRAYRAALSGDNSFRTHRQLQQSLDPRRLNYSEVAFPAFGDWW